MSASSLLGAGYEAWSVRHGDVVGQLDAGR